jgi:UDP-3-O-[3-hydroxymyristoyl] glucosamine N-acyltransferase
MRAVPLTLKELADRIGAEPAGNLSVVIESASTLEDAKPGQISFLANPKYAKQLDATSASAVIVSPKVNVERQINLLRAKDPYYAFAQAVVALHGFRVHPHHGIHPRAHVDPTATVGEGTIIYPGVFVGPRTKVGRDCILFPNVVIYDDCVIGDRVVIHANSSIGQDGYGYATNGGVHHKIPQTGNVVIEDDVEIGANCSIDRAALDSTVIGKGTKFSDAISIGHGTKIGEHCLIVAQVGIAGSVVVGHHVTMAGQVGVAGHLKIGDNVTVAAQSGILHDVPDNSVILGSPAMPLMHARRTYAIFRNLPELQDRVKKLEGLVEELGTNPGAGLDGGEDANDARRQP